MVDMQAYLSRIHLADSRTLRPDLVTLKTLQQYHTAAIPFENIDVLLDRGIRLDPESIDNKLIHHGRGGYCFEQNDLFMRVLRHLGFTVEPLIARVEWNRPEGAALNPRTHMVLRVTIAQTSYLADVGFGGLVLTSPLRFDNDQTQSTHHEPFRLRKTIDGYQLDVAINGEWRPVYELSDEPQEPIDFEVANWYTSKHPDSKFRQNLMIARATTEARYTLLNNRLVIRSKDGNGKKQELDVEALCSALSELFMLPYEGQWGTLLEDICRKN